MGELSDTEVKLIRLLAQFDEMQRHCDDLSLKIENNLAWKHDLRIIEHEVSALKETGMKTAEQITWLLRLFFAALVSGASATMVFLIQHQ